MSYMNYVCCKNISSFFFFPMYASHLSLYHSVHIHTLHIFIFFIFYFLLFFLTERPKELVHRRSVSFHFIVIFPSSEISFVTIGSGSGSSGFLLL